MADTTISQLTQSTPAGSSILPYSTGSNTLGVPVSAIFQNTNRVGIGTSTPGYPLEVADNDFPYILLRGSNSNSLAIYGGTTSTDYSVVHSGINKDLSISSNGGVPLGGLYIKASGNIGIGTLTPTTKLDVAGTVNATNIYKGGVEVPIGLNGTLLYSTAGSSTWTVPPLITRVRITAVGGGGGSGGAASNVTPTAGSQTTVVLGATTLTAGGGGNSANSSSAGGAGGTASGGTYNINGQDGTDGNYNNVGSGLTFPVFGGRAPFALSISGVGGNRSPSSTPLFGGGGGGSYNTGFGGSIGAGGSGGVSTAVITTTPGSTATITVGAGGNGATSVNTGSSAYIYGQAGAAGCVLIEW